MKKVSLLLLLISTSFKLFAQYPSPFINEKIDSANGSKNELFVRANEWISKSFNDAKSVIQMSDKDAGKIIVKGVMTIYRTEIVHKAEYRINFILSVDVKDGKYRCRFSDFMLIDRHCGNAYNSYNALFDNDKPKGIFSIEKKIWEDLKNLCWQETNIYMKDLQSSISIKNDKW